MFKGINVQIIACHLVSEGFNYHRVDASTRRSTLGDRSFPVAAARAWNALPRHVRNAASLPAFRLELKSVLFRLSFPVAW